MERGRDRSEQALRADRILEAAGELLLRFGYKRVTIEDIATRAEVGKGTVYLHWKTKHELFAVLLLREVAEVTRELLAGMRADPAEVLLHRVTRASFLSIMRRPLARALYTRDLDTLGKLAASEAGGLAARRRIADTYFEKYIDLVRSHGLLRTDTDRRLSDEEVVNFSVVLLITGHITTTALLGNTVLCVDEHPMCGPGCTRTARWWRPPSRRRCGTAPRSPRSAG